MEALKLKNQKKYALAVEFAEFKKPLKEDASTTKSQEPYGLVTGIVYSPEKSSAVVDQKIVHEGDTIRCVVVAKIHKDKVLFEKSGNKWEQGVRQTPGTYWE
jgi:type II secretory pathway component PulC